MDSWTRVCQVALVALLSGVCLLVVYFGWRNSRIIAGSEKAIRDDLNQVLKARKLDPIRVVALPSASRVFGVPEQIDFEHNLFRTDDMAGRRPVGWLSGTFDRRSGELQMDLQFFDGKRERGITRKLPPVP